MGLQPEFPIIICNLATGTDTIIGTDVLGSVLPHTLDIKNGLLFTKGGASLQLHRRDSVISGHVLSSYAIWPLQCTSNTCASDGPGTSGPLVDPLSSLSQRYKIDF